MQSVVTWGAGGRGLAAAASAFLRLLTYRLFEAPLGSRRAAHGRRLRQRRVFVMGMGASHGTESGKSMWSQEARTEPGSGNGPDHEWGRNLTTAATPGPSCVALGLAPALPSPYRDFLGLGAPASACPGLSCPTCTSLEGTTGSAYLGCPLPMHWRGVTCSLCAWAGTS